MYDMIMSAATIKISFCLTEDELRSIDDARQRVAALGFLQNRSEIIRTAIAVLNAMPAEDVVHVINEVPRLMPGRRSSS